MPLKMLFHSVHITLKIRHTKLIQNYFTNIQRDIIPSNGKIGLYFFFSLHCLIVFKFISLHTLNEKKFKWDKNVWRKQGSKYEITEQK